MLIENINMPQIPSALLVTQGDDAPTADAMGNPLLAVDEILISREEIADPSLFLATERGKEWMKPLLSGAYHSQWYDCQRSPHEMKWCTKLADRILDMKREGACPGEIEDMIEEEFGRGQSAEDTYHEEHESSVTSALETLSEALDEMRDDDEDVPDMDLEAWSEAVRDIMIDHMYENDDSSVMDMFGSWDYCEITFRLGGEDDVESQKKWADFDHLAINWSLQKALASLGYTIGDYRRMTGNRTKSNGLGRVARRPQPLVTEDELRELVSEACSTHFNFVIYAMVPVQDLVTLDLTKPISLSNYSVASYDSMNGTFYDKSGRQAITIQPGEGHLEAPRGYSPDGICGFVHSYYHSKIANVD